MVHTHGERVGLFVVAGIIALTPLSVSAQSAIATSTDTPQHIKALLADVAVLHEQLQQLTGEASSTPDTYSSPWCLIITKTLAKGSSGQEVRALQQVLSQDPAIYSGDITGYFGSVTQAAVLRVQEKFGIATTSGGTVGPLTRAFFRKQCTLPVVASTTSQTVSPAPIKTLWKPLDHVLKWFANAGSSTSIKAPIIASINGPSTLLVGQKGEWVITVSDPSDGKLSYEVNWGDSATSTRDTPSNTSASDSKDAQENIQDQSDTSATSTFHHIYQHPDTYTVTIAVTSLAGISTQITATVVVAAANIETTTTTQTNL
jgi:peptidoglycan hydrolase-like protein with peptidoglycan-binding domain